MLHVYDQRFDVMWNLKNFYELNKASVWHDMERPKECRFIFNLFYLSSGR